MRYAGQYLQQRRAGIAALSRKNYDMLMPEMNGIDVAKQIIDRCCRKTPLVLFSSAGHFPEERKADKKLFVAILDKPIKQDYFYKMLIDKLSVTVKDTKPVAQVKASVTAEVDADVSILIAEDNLINQKIVSKAFKNIGYTVDLLSNGLEVLSSLKRQHFGHVYMDVHMPEMDGLQATRKIIEEYGEGRPVIIAMTAEAYEKDKQDCLNAGMDDHVSKPLDLENLYYKFNFWKGKIQNKQ